MFGCFSKKKKQKPTPLQPHKSTPSKTTQLQSTEETHNPHATTSTLPPKKSKFCNISAHHQAHPQPNSKSTSLNMIDNILQEEMESSSLPCVQEETAHFPEFLELKENRQENSRFGNISSDNDSQFAQNNYYKFKDTKSYSLELDQIAEEEVEEHCVPKSIVEDLHTLTELTERSTRSRRSQKRRGETTRHPGKPKSQDLGFGTINDYDSYDSSREQWALDTTISLQNFKISTQKIQQKISEELEDRLLLGETLEEAENGFYCNDGNAWEEFTRATIANTTPQLSKRIYQRMNMEQKNRPNFKGYTPVQLLVLKTISNDNFLEFTKAVLYDPEISLQCKGPTGWTPLQEALFYRNIPLVTHLFKAGYSKKQEQYQAALRRFTTVLAEMPDFEMEIDVKIDSFLPLVGSLTPNDTLKIKKQKNCLRLNYSLVGYEFPSCKRRDMEIMFDGTTLWAVNNSKKVYCDLLEQLQHEEMILMIEDMLSGEIKRGWPIVHSVSIVKALSLFQNQITEEMAGRQACKHNLQLCYTSTSEKRRSQVKSSNEQFGFLSSYDSFKEKRQSITIKEKNRNKKVELELWLAKDFGIEVSQLLHILQILSMGNSLIAEWSKFFKDQVGAMIEKSGYFPVKIDIPLNYSLFFNIEFKSFKRTNDSQTSIAISEQLKQIPRKEFQGTLASKQKRAVFIQVYT